MLSRIALFGLGLLLLYVGANGLVRGASRLARWLGVSPLVIGLTVVAFGTSAPELVVSVLAAGAGEADVAIGNVVGSNIANIGLILGVSAVVCPLGVHSRLLRREIPVMIAASVGLVALMLDGGLGRADAALCLLGFAAYLLFVSRTARTSTSELAPAATGIGSMAGERGGDRRGAPSPVPGAVSRWSDVGLVVLGLTGLVVGAHLLVESSVWFARRMGVPELVVGLTLVAVGTSLPELATSVVAALHRESEIAVGNVVGSNVFNTLAILGTAGLVAPLDFDASILRFELPVMVGSALVLLPLGWSRFEIQRWEGVALVAGYCVFVLVLVARVARAG